MAGTGPAMSGYPRIGGAKLAAWAGLGWDSQKSGEVRGVSLTLYSQLCDLPAASLNDQLPQHTFRVIWTAGDAQKECVLLKGDATCSLHLFQQPPISFLLSWVSPPTTDSFSQAARRPGAGTQPQISSSSGDDREAHGQGEVLWTLGIRQLGWEAGGLGRLSQLDTRDNWYSRAVSIIPSPHPRPPAGVSCRWRSPRCYSPSLNPVRSCRNWNLRINVRLHSLSSCPLQKAPFQGGPLGIAQGV